MAVLKDIFSVKVDLGDGLGHLDALISDAVDAAGDVDTFGEWHFRTEWKPYTNPRTGEAEYISTGGLVRKAAPTAADDEADHHSQAAHALTAGLERLFPDAVTSNPSVWGKIKDKALTVAAVAYMHAVKATPAMMAVVGKVLPEIVDHPNDFTKLGFNPGLSGTHGPTVHDPVKDALGIGAHTAAAIASHVLSRVFVMLKSKVAGTVATHAQGDGIAELVALMKAVADAAGAPFDPAAATAAITQLATTAKMSDGADVATPLASVTAGTTGEPASGEVALAGRDGAALARLIVASKDAGVTTLATLVRDALKKYPGKGPLLDRAGVGALGQSLAAVNATAELLGRSRVREMALRAETFGDLSKFADTPLVAFGEAPALTTPEAAVDYFTGLVPKLGIDPERFAGEQRRRAFTLAVSANRVLTGRIQGIIADGLKENRSAADTTAGITSAMNQAGVSHRNPQYACFLPGTLVEGDVLAASQAWYSGPAVEIQTHHGRRLRVTINHPVLTPGGWKRAGDVREGEQLVCHASRVEPLAGGVPQRRAVHDQEVPARIEDVFQTLRRERPAGNHVERPCGPLDFHGDAARFVGKVNRVAADGVLVRGGDTNFGESGLQLPLMLRHVASASLSRHRRGPLRHALSAMLGSGAIEAGKDFLDAAGFGRWRENRPLHSLRIGAAANLNPGRFHAVDKRPGGDSQLARELVVSLPGKVTKDRVVKVNRIDWTGHVYDLQTRCGFIVSQGIITSNSMVFRTNAMDAFQTGLYEEGRHPDVREMFPCYQYVGIDDERAGDDHRPNFGRYFDASIPFAEARGPRGYNCRCSLRWVDRFEWDDLHAGGERMQVSQSRQR